MSRDLEEFTQVVDWLNLMENFLCVSLSHRLCFSYALSKHSHLAIYFLCFLNSLDSRCQGILFLRFSYSCICRIISPKQPLNKMLSRENWPCWFRVEQYCAGLMGQPRVSSADIEGYMRNKPRAFVWYIWWSQSGRRKYYGRRARGGDEPNKGRTSWHRCGNGDSQGHGCSRAPWCCTHGYW
jgi:hypothetical protein